MGLIDAASTKSVWRGMDYYQDHKALTWKQSGQDTYCGIVSGSEHAEYNVQINTSHLRKSTCSCPFAEGRRVVCKHMIALYFAAEPKAAEHFLEEQYEWEEQEDEREFQHYQELEKYVKTLSKTELRTELLEALLEIEELQTCL